MKKQNFIDKCLKDSEGKTVLAQKPNFPILIWLGSLLLRPILSGNLYTLIDLIGFGALFTWAYLELFQGINYFRRLLGLVVLIVALYSRLY
jgi:hypothetical protein